MSNVETNWYSESPGESGEASQRILNSIGGVVSKFSGDSASVDEPTSSVVLEEMVHEVSHER